MDVTRTSQVHHFLVKLIFPSKILSPIWRMLPPSNWLLKSEMWSHLELLLSQSSLLSLVNQPIPPPKGATSPALDYCKRLPASPPPAAASRHVPCRSREGQDIFSDCTSDHVHPQLNTARLSAALRIESPLLKTLSWSFSTRPCSPR